MQDCTHSTDSPDAPQWNMSQTFFLTTHNHSLKLAAHPKRGRGVYATKTIPANTLVDISPILFFTPEEYQAHGRHTILDHYTYKWQNGSMALALGLGSLFNHSSRCQNVGFIRDFEHSCIKYYTLRDIQPEQELFISYGDHLWFDDGGSDGQDRNRDQSDQVNDGARSDEETAESFLSSFE